MDFQGTQGSIEHSRGMALGPKVSLDSPQTQSEVRERLDGISVALKRLESAIPEVLNRTAWLCSEQPPSTIPPPAGPEVGKPLQSSSELSSILLDLSSRVHTQADELERLLGRLQV